MYKQGERQWSPIGQLAFAAHKVQLYRLSKGKAKAKISERHYTSEKHLSTAIEALKQVCRHFERQAARISEACSQKVSTHKAQVCYQVEILLSGLNDCCQAC